MRPWASVVALAGVFFWLSCGGSGGSGPKGSSTGSLSVLSTPSGASILLNHVTTDEETPHTFSEMDTGWVRITVTLPDFFADSALVYVHADSESTVNFTLVAVGAPVGNLFLSSTPPGVLIHLDGNNTGKTTPDSLKNLAIGNHNIQLTLAGYFDSTFSATVLQDQTVQVNTVLRRIPAGNVLLTSTPPGAAITLDDVSTGTFTPDTLKNLAPGDYNIKLSLSGYLDSVFVVTIIDNQTITSSTVLRPIPSGDAFITSSPAGAAILLNNAPTGQTTPDTLKNLTPGNYTVKLTLPGYVDSTFVITIIDQQVITSSTVLHPIPSGDAFITSSPTGAAILLNNAPTGQTTPDTLKDLTPGNYTVKLTLPGYVDSTFVITIIDQQVITSSTVLRPIPSGDAFITSSPAGAAIFLDNSPTGQTTPDTLKDLTPGDYTVKLTLTGYFDTTFVITVVDQQLTHSSISLQRIPSGDLFISSTPSGATVFLDNAPTGKLTPDTLKFLSPGDYDIKLVLRGFLDSVFTVTVQDALLVTSSVTLRQARVPVNIQQIFTNHCIACHSGSAPPQGQNLSEDSAYVHIVNVTARENTALKRILPFNPNDSYLVRKIEGVNITGARMPANGPPYLSQTQIDSVRAWVTRGALPR